MRCATATFQTLIYSEERLFWKFSGKNDTRSPWWKYATNCRCKLLQGSIQVLFKINGKLKSQYHSKETLSISQIMFEAPMQLVVPVTFHVHM